VSRGPDRGLLIAAFGGFAAALLLVGVVLVIRAQGSPDTGTVAEVGSAPTSTTEPSSPALPSPGDGVAPTSSAGSGAPSGPVSFGAGSVANGVRTQTGTVPDGIVQRPFTVLSPADVAPGERLPVVVALHGLTVDSGAMSRAADWRGAVARDRFIAVFPQGVFDSWNAGPCCPPASALGTDDIGYLDEVVRQLDTRADVDPNRRYLTGFSNGGVMTYTIACARPELFAAVAPMAGSNFSDCSPDAPVSLLHQHGAPDPGVPYDGRPTPSQVLSTAPFPRVPESVAEWARSAGCSGVPARRDEGSGAVRLVWNGCSDGARVELLTYPGNQHRWPNAPLDGLDAVLRFFDVRR